MTSGKDDEEFFKQRGFGIKMGFGERPALILIDMLKGFTDAKMPLGANLDKEIAAQKPLLEVAHERNIPVIFSTVIYNDHDLKDAGLWAIKMKGTLTLKAGNVGGELLNWIAMLGAIGHRRPNTIAPQLQNGHAYGVWRWN